MESWLDDQVLIPDSGGAWDRKDVVLPSYPRIFHVLLPLCLNRGCDQMDWPAASIILGILATIMVAIIKFIPSKTRVNSVKTPINVGNNPVNSVSEKVCKARMEKEEASVRGVHHRIGELEKNLGNRMGTLETSVNNLIAKL